MVLIAKIKYSRVMTQIRERAGVLMGGELLSRSIEVTVDAHGDKVVLADSAGGATFAGRMSTMQ